jgi:hypothetical protein
MLFNSYTIPKKSRNKYLKDNGGNNTISSVASDYLDVQIEGRTIVNKGVANISQILLDGGNSSEEWD